MFPVLVDIPDQVPSNTEPASNGINNSVHEIVVDPVVASSNGQKSPYFCFELVVS